MTTSEEVKLDPKLQLRKLDLRLLRELEAILDSDDLWKPLMCKIPKTLNTDPTMSKISHKNPPKYNTEHFKIIESVSVKDRRSCTNILFDEWGTSGKVLPTVGHLFSLLKQAGVYRAGDLLADLLGVPRPERPATGPDALVKIQDVAPIIRVSGSIMKPTNVNRSVSHHHHTVHFENDEPDLDFLLRDSEDVSNQSAVTPEQTVSENQMPDFSAIMPSGNPSTVSSGALPNLSMFQSTTDNNVSNSGEYLPQFSKLGIDTSNEPITPQENSVPNLSFFQSTQELPVILLSNDQNNSSHSRNTNSSRMCSSPLPSLSLNTSLPHFSYVDLERCTNNFNNDPYTSRESVGRYLGHGAFGSVYVAFDLIKDPVAVKKLNLDLVNNNQMDQITKQFRNEVEILSKFKHDNLLALLGYSHDGCTYCLVYEYMSGGTLHDKIQSQENRLHWKERLNISLGLSKAITYLHTEFKDPVIHRDIKSPNILLDESNKAKLGDFGLVRNIYNNHTSTFTSAIGTSAYMSDEALRGEISYKMDTYSFGIVLLELLTSLPVRDESRQEVCLNDHVEFQYSTDGNGSNLLDRHEEVGDWIANGIDIGEKLIEIALRCLKKKKIRPDQSEITENLLDLVKQI